MDSRHSARPFPLGSIDPMEVAYQLALQGLAEQVAEEELRNDSRLFDEYVTFRRYDSVSGVDSSRVRPGHGGIQLDLLGEQSEMA